jgi:DNA-binding LacI/PurR family transcriptional regulator
MAIEKQTALTAELRELIVGGGYRPGDRLPPRTDLEARFQVSSVTLQRAMNTLATAGFIESCGRQGTVVVEHPPYLHHYGLLLPCQSTSKLPLLRSWKVIVEVARQVLGQRPNRLSIFYQGDLQQSMSASQAFQGDIAAHRLAGLIVPSLPVLHLADLIESGGNGFPLVAYHGEPFPGAAATRCNDRAAVARVLDFLQSRGRTRIGQLVPGAWYENPHYETEFMQPLAGRGMRCERYWLQVLLPQAPQGVRNAAEMLARAPDGPNAIILHDDNAVQEAIDGIRAAGKRIPEDIELVAWGNFPWPDQYTAPVKRFGVDIMQLVCRAKDYIDARRRGETPERVIELDVIDEEEAKQRSEIFSGQRVLMPER